jgi:hypothetical protein
MLRDNINISWMCEQIVMQMSLVTSSNTIAPQIFLAIPNLTMSVTQYYEYIQTITYDLKRNVISVFKECS